MTKKRKYTMVNRKPTDPDAERRGARERMSAKRAAGRDIIIPPVADPKRRERGRNDPEFFLSTYFPETFYNPFCPHHLAMIHSLEQRILYGGRQAIAAPRGDGKSSIVEAVGGVWAIVYGHIKFVVIFGAGEREGMDRKGNIMAFYEKAPLLLEDFPEVCMPILALEKAGRRGHQQTVNGVFTDIRWSSGETSKELRLPTVEGSEASGAWIVVRGMEKGTVRGLNKYGIRPDLAIIDDGESDDSASSEYRTEKIERKINHSIIPLAGPNTRIAIFMPCTIISIGCIADRFTDPAKYPENASWMGQRHALVTTWPTCHGADGEADLWAVYRRMRREDQLEGDETGRRANRFYVENREAMDAGCVVSNAYRFDVTPCGDGTPVQVSAIQAVMDGIADGGDNEKAWAAFNAEFQNCPDESNAPEGSDCTEDTIKRALNGVAKGLCPPGTEFLTAGMDIHKRRVFWVVVAWVGSHAHVVDYGAVETHGPEKSMTGDDAVTEDVKRAIFNTISEWSEGEAEGRPVKDTGEVKYLDRVLIDSRFLPDPIYDFCGKAPGRTYHPVSGSGGKMRDTYRPPRKNSNEAQIGRFHYYAVRQADRGIWLIHADSDYWVEHIQNGFVNTVSLGDRWSLNARDAVALYGTDRLLHRDMASHVMAEEFVTQFVPGRGLESKRIVRHSGNHWLDCLVYAFTAGALAGVKFGHQAVAKTRARPAARSRVAGTAKITV